MWTHTLLYLHRKDIHPVHSLLQLKLSRGGHWVNVLIVSVVVRIRVSAEHLKDSVQYVV